MSNVLLITYLSNVFCIILLYYILFLYYYLSFTKAGNEPAGFFSEEERLL